MTINDYNEIFSYPIVKQMTLRFSETGQTDIVLTNSDICSEEMSLEESLCSGEDLRFGACESSCFKVRVVNSNTFKGKKLTVSMQIVVDDDRYLVDADGNRIVTDTGDYIVVNFGTKDDSIPLGVYTVYSDELSDDRMWRDLTCYDSMYEVLNTDVAAWYSALTFPMTIKNFRDSFFTHLGITQVTTTLINDSFTTAGGFVAEGELAGKTIIEAICEMNGVFGHINRSGNFEYIGLPSSVSITPKWYIDGTGKYEDYTTDVITGVIARSEASDVGTSVGTDTNLLIIENNPLVYGAEGTQALTTALTNILNNLSSFTFRPFEVKTYGNPCLPIGTGITINTKKYDSVNGYSPFAINSFIKSRVLEGIQALTDSFSTPGKKKRDGTANSLQSQIQRTAGKVHKVQVDLDTFISEIEDADYGTKIEQNAQNITLEAKRRAISEETFINVTGYEIPEDLSNTIIYKTSGTIPYQSGGWGIPQNKKISVWVNISIPYQYDSYEKLIEITVSSDFGPMTSYLPIYYNNGVPLTNQFGRGSFLHLTFMQNQQVYVLVDPGPPEAWDLRTLTGWWIGADEAIAQLKIESDRITSYVGNNFVTKTTYNAEVQNLQDQIDGRVEYYDGDYVPTLNNAPANTWTTTSAKDSHIGDIFRYKPTPTSTTTYYRFDRSGNVYSWVELGETEATEALRLAQEANQKADDAQDAIDLLEGDFSEMEQTQAAITARVSAVEKREIKDVTIASTTTIVAGRVYKLTTAIADAEIAEGLILRILIPKNLTWESNTKKYIQIKNLSSNPTLYTDTFPIYYEDDEQLTNQLSNGNIMTIIFYEDYEYYEGENPSTINAFVVSTSDRTYTRLESELNVERGRIVLKVDSNGNIGTQELSADPQTGLTSFNISADSLHFVANKKLDISAANLSITSRYFKVATDGTIESTGGVIGGWNIEPNGLYKIVGSRETTINPNSIHLEDVAYRWQEGQEYSLDLKSDYLGFEYNNSPVFEITPWMPDNIVMETTGTIVTNGYRLQQPLAGFYYSIDDLLYSLMAERCALGHRYQFTFACFGEVTTGRTELHLWAPCKFQPNVPDGRNLTVHALTQSVKCGNDYSSTGYIGGLNSGASILSYLTRAFASRITDELVLELNTDGSWTTKNHQPVAGTIYIDFTI